MKVVTLIYCLVIAFQLGSSEHHQNKKVKVTHDISELTTLIKNEDSEAQNWQRWTRLGVLLREKDVIFGTGDGTSQAVGCFEKALDLSDKSDHTLQFSLHLQVGVLQALLGRGIEASRAFNRSSNFKDAIDISNIDRSTLISHQAETMHTFLRNPSKASELYSEALRLNPCAVGPYWQYVKALAECKEANETDWTKILTWLKEIATKYVTDDGQLSDACSDFFAIQPPSKYLPDLDLMAYYPVRPSILYWAIFSVAERSGALDEAWDALEKAHRLDMLPIHQLPVHQQLDHGEDPDFSPKKSVFRREQANNITSMFKAGYWPSPSLGIGSATKVPVFIVGFFRSGSTLLETLLDAHSNIFGIGEESVFITEIINLQNSEIHIVSGGSAVDSALDPGARWLRMKDLINEYADKILNGMANKAQSLVNQQLREMKLMNENNFLSNSRTPRGSKTLDRIVDKLLSNFRFIGLIHLLFPNAIIIHTMRDPMDTLFSCYKTNFVSAKWTLNVDSLVEEFVLYLKLMQHYREELPGRVLDVSYEALVASPEATMRKVIRSVGMPWDPNILDFHLAGRLTNTANTASIFQIRKPVYLSSVGNWKRYADKLGPIRSSFARQLLELNVSISGLPMYTGDSRMNWDCSIDFNYTEMLQNMTMQGLAYLKENENNDTILRSRDSIEITEIAASGSNIGSDGLIQSNKFKPGEYISDDWKYFWNSKYLVDINPASDLQWKKDFQNLEFSSPSRILALIGSISQAINIELTKKENDLQIIPTAVPLFVQRGCFYLSMEDFLSATDDFETALELLGILKLKKPGSSMGYSISPELWQAQVRCIHHGDEIDSTLSGNNNFKTCSRNIAVRALGVPSIFYFLGSALNSLPRKDKRREGLIYLREAVLLDPLDMGLVNAYLEALSNSITLSKYQWGTVMNGTVGIVQLFGNELTSIPVNKKGQSSQREDGEIVMDESMTARVGLALQRVQESGIYWTLHTIGDKCIGPSIALKDGKSASGDELAVGFAWKYLQLAHKLDLRRLAKSKTYDVSTSVKATDELIAIYRTGFWPVDKLALGSNNQQLVFIVGFFGSGSLTLEKLLDHHQQIFPAKSSSLLVFRKLLKSLENSIQMMRSNIASNEMQINEAYDVMKEMVEDTSKEFLKETLRAHLTISDKNAKLLIPLDIDIKYVGIIHLLFPNSSIIHIMRDPMDTVISCYRTKFYDDDLLWTLDMESLVAEYVLNLKLAQHFRKHLPDRLIEVNFEALTVAPEATMNALFNNLKLPTSVDKFYERIAAEPSSNDKDIGEWVRYKSQLQPILKSLKKRLWSIGYSSKSTERGPAVATCVSIRKHGRAADQSSDGLEDAANKINSSSEIEMNWGLDSNFDYRALRKAVVHVTNQCNDV